MKATILTLTQSRIVLSPLDALEDGFKEHDVVIIEAFDPTKITTKQRNMIFALIHEIASFIGDVTSLMKDSCIQWFCIENKHDWFSLSDCKKEVASEFIRYLIEFCLRHSIPLKQNAYTLCEDTEHYLQQCIINRVCSVCGNPHKPSRNQPVYLHHIDAIGMGGNRKKESHIGKRVIALCWLHHDEIHQKGVSMLDALYLPHGVRLTHKLYEKIPNHWFVESG